jgi:hypothetical protein
MTTELITSTPPTPNGLATIDPQQFTQLMQMQARIDQRLAGLEVGMGMIAAQQRNGEQLVKVQDISMGFGAMVSFMVKWAIAAIPAAIILGALFAFAWIAFFVFGGILFGAMR